MYIIELPPVAGQCRKMDLILVLDRSASINKDDYEHMRHFLLSIGKSLKIGERDKDGEVIGQGAIITFSEEGTLRISLKESQTPGKFAQVVKDMPGPLPGGRTKTHKGLDVADKEAVTSEAGLRVNDPKVEKIFMVITDGEQTVESVRRGWYGFFHSACIVQNKLYISYSESNISVMIIGYKYVGEAMEPFHDRGYLNVFSVGVGLSNEKGKTEVRDMVRKPENAILAENYKELIATVETFIRQFCPGKLS